MLGPVASDSTVWRLLDRLDEPELAAIASARAAAREIVWAQRAEVAGDCIRLRVLRIHSQLNQKTAIQFLDYLLERLPFRVEVIQTTALSSAPASTGTPSTPASATATSSRAPRG